MGMNGSAELRLPDYGPQDHDQRFKTLLHEFLPEFMELFLPEQAAVFDFSNIKWIEQEVFPDPPAGERRMVDVVAELFTKRPVAGQAGSPPQSWLSLIHVEIEARDSLTLIRERLFEYYTHLRHKYRRPVPPIGLYLNVGLDGLGLDSYREEFNGIEIVKFQFPYVGLPKLDAVQYLEENSPLGVALAALMKKPREREVWLKAEAWRRVEESSVNEFQKFLLTECVNAYLPLRDPAQQAEFKELIQKDQYQEVRKMTTTFHEEGRVEGRLEGKREVVRMLLEARFDTVDANVVERLEKMSADQLETVAKRLLTANSLEEVGLARSS